MTPAPVLRQLWGGHRWLLVTVGLLILANVALALVLHQYLVPTVSQREQLLIRRQAEVRGREAGGGSPVQQFVQGERDLAAFRERIPPHREFTGLIIELQDLADNSGLELAQVSYRFEQDSNEPQLRYRLAFYVSGSYRAIKQFVHALEQSPRLIIIEQIGLQGVEQEDAADVRLQLSLETFFRTGTP